MNKEEEIAKVLFESGVALDGTDFAFGIDGDDHFTKLAMELVKAGYGNVKQAVREFAEKLKEKMELNGYRSALHNQIIDNLITQLYGDEQ